MFNMMAMSFHSYHDSGSISDSVFKEDLNWLDHNTYSPQYNNRVHLPNSSASFLGSIYSSQELPAYSPRESTHSPTVSTYSTYSQEVKYLFDPKFGDHQSRSWSQTHLNMQSTPSHCEQFDMSANSTEEDYSQIQIFNRKLGVQRKGSNSSQYSNKGHIQNLYQAGGHIYSKSNPPPPPPRTSSSASSHLSLPGDATQLASRKSLFQSMTASYYYPYHQARRKTWSPEGLQIEAALSNKRNRLRSYSNEQLLENESATDSRDHLYEELETGPPKLAPISGMLTQSPGRGLVKPIAFKPVVTQKFVTTPKQNVEQTRKYSSHDDGYGSQDYGVTNQNGANTSHGSLHMEFDRSASFTSDFNRTPDRTNSVTASNLSRLSSSHIDGYAQTPSPSDSGVGELEAILKEKDAELYTLRDVMDKNERAIFQVYEEKRNAWVREIQDIKEEYENKVKHFQRKAFKSEQLLNLQILKLQQDKKTMKDEIDKLNAEKDDVTQKCESFAEETNRLQAQMDDATWQAQGHRQLGDISNLQSEIDNLQSKLNMKAEEVLRLQAKLDETKSKSDEAKHNHVNQNKIVLEQIRHDSSEYLPKSDSSDIAVCHSDKEAQTDFTKARSPEMETLKPSLICERDKELSSLREELDKYRLEMLVNKKEYDKEKEQWLEEKNKVIMYQKQLQLNYVQMFRKNKVLEAEVEQLTLELESRDMKLMALNGEESVC